MDYWRINNGYKTTLVYNYRMIDFWLLVAKSIYALLLTQNVGVNILSVFQNIDDLELEECCRSIKRLAVPLVGKVQLGLGTRLGLLQDCHCVQCHETVHDVIHSF